MNFLAKWFPQDDDEIIEAEFVDVEPEAVHVHVEPDGGEYLYGAKTSGEEVGAILGMCAAIDESWNSDIYQPWRGSK